MAARSPARYQARGDFKRRLPRGRRSIQFQYSAPVIYKACEPLQLYTYIRTIAATPRDSPTAGGASHGASAAASSMFNMHREEYDGEENN